MHRHLLLSIPLLLAAVLSLLGPGDAAAQTSGVETTTIVESNFPDGIRFGVTIESTVEVVEARVRYRVLGERVSRYAPLEFAPSRTIETDLFVRTDTAARYIPPGAEIEYTVETTDRQGVTTESEPQRFVLLDPRFAWSRLDAPGVFLLYYGGQQGRAQRALEAAQEALTRMGNLMGVTDPDTLRLAVYNSIPAMREALPPTSQVREESLVTEGISFGDTGVVLLLGGNPELEGVAAHETVHFLMRFAVGSGARSVPIWLNEGLAEYANPFPSPTFESLLSRRLASNTLIPLTSLTSAPGRPEDNLLLYGQGRSVVTYMIDAYGEAPLQALLQRLREGDPIDDALTAAYGFDRVGLDQEWRASIGAAPLTATPSRSALPTPIPRPTLVPFGAATSSSPEATAQPRPAPTEAPASTEPATEPAEQGSGGCNRAEGGGLDVGAVAPLLLGLGLLWRRIRPRAP